MKLLTLLAAITIAGCSGSTNVNSKLDVAGVSPSEFVAGGLTYATNDTLEDFDFRPHIRVTNPTNESLPLLIKCNFSAAGSTRPGTATIDLGELAAGASRTLDSSFVVRIPTGFAGENVVCDMIFISGNPDGGSFATYSQTRLDIPFSSRYHGFLYTTESSPDPLATLDQPLDWFLSAGPAHLDGIFPNPAYGSTSIRLTLNAAIDSVKGLLRITPNSPADTIFSMPASMSGVWTIESDLTKQDPGLYRLEVIVWSNGQPQLAHANVSVRRF